MRTKLGATITLSDTTSAPGGGRYATFMQPMIELEIDLVRIVRRIVTEKVCMFVTCMA